MTVYRRRLYTPDGRLRGLGRRDSARICVWDAATGRKLREIGDFASRLQEIALSPDGKTLATIEAPGGLRLRDFATGREQRRWHEAKNEFYRHLAFSPDGRYCGRRCVAVR